MLPVHAKGQGYSDRCTGRQPTIRANQIAQPRRKHNPLLVKERAPGVADADIGDAGQLLDIGAYVRLARSIR